MLISLGKILSSYIGDNSVKSLDSRQFGAIDKKTVRGIALKIISPYDQGNFICAMFLIRLRNPPPMAVAMYSGLCRIF